MDSSNDCSRQALEPSAELPGLWQQAWAWVEREHDPGRQGPFHEAELARWLAQDSAHRKSYALACQVWQLERMADVVPVP